MKLDGQYASIKQNQTKTAKILEELGYKPKAYQENKRSQYLTKDLEFNM